jgi:DHA2 family multidrug resistance protein-like MFS transporter
MTPLEAGLWTLPWALSFIVSSNVTPILARRIEPAWLMGGGLVLAALGFGVLLGIEAGSGLALIVVGSVGFSLGMSPAFTLTNDLIIGSAPPERAGAAAGVSETAAEVGGALGIAVLGSIGVAVYRRGVDDVLPGSLSTEESDAAQGTLGGALEVAAGQPTPFGEALTAAAEAAFTTGLHLGALIAAITSLGLAVFVLARGRVGLATEEPELVDQTGLAADGPFQEGQVGRG